jgi:PII-like signaling protein
MTLRGERVLLRVYLRAADRPPHVPTYARVVKAARHEGLAGATVLRGVLGFGSHGVTRPSAWSLARYEPVVVEIVDTGEKIVRFLHGALAGLMLGGMATLERAAVIVYRDRPGDRPGEPPDPEAMRLAPLLEPRSTLPRIEPRGRMTVNEDGILLRVFVGESDRFERQPLYEAIVQKARDLGLAGATVLRGTEGFGARSVVHRAQLLEMSSDLPVVIEVVDTEAKIKLLLPPLESMVREGMITMEYVTILLYRDGGSDALREDS